MQRNPWEIRSKNVIKAESMGQDSVSRVRHLLSELCKLKSLFPVGSHLLRWWSHSVGAGRFLSHHGNICCPGEPGHPQQSAWVKDTPLILKLVHHFSLTKPILTNQTGTRSFSIFPVPLCAGDANQSRTFEVASGKNGNHFVCTSPIWDCVQLHVYKYIFKRLGGKTSEKWT